MFLVDSDIRDYCQKGKLIVENYNPENIGAISYDLSIDKIIIRNETNTDYKSGIEIYPMETLFVSTEEVIDIPNNFIGYVSEKNSVMREGLMVAAPIYQPGHKTKCYIRVTNISNNIITLDKGKKIAQIHFCKLDKSPETPYNKNPKSSFNEELQYIGLGRYEEQYKREIKQIEKAKENLEEKEHSIYANVLTIMGIIAAIFSILTLNFGAFNSANFTPKTILSLNLSMTFIILILSSVILFIVNKKHKWWTYVLFGIITLSLLLINICLFV